MVHGSFPDGELDEAAELGALTDRSVRLWVRAPHAERMAARLEVEGQPPVEASVAVSAATDWTGAAELSLPAPMSAPDRPFTCVVGQRRLSGRLAPAPETHGGFSFGFGSCHEPFEVVGETIRLNRAAGIYAAMRAELLREEARFLLLCGDQIYSDTLDSISVRDDLPGDDDHPPPLVVAQAAYRHIARGFLAESGFRALRETFPSYWIWDDHDVFNNWGSRLKESPLDRCLFRAASRTYCEYQHLRNPGGAIGAPPYGYRFRFGTAGFLVLDVRGARDYTTGRLLGTAQWEVVQAYLAGAESRELHTLFVVTSVPVAHVSRWFVELFQHLPFEKGSDVRDRWCSAAFVKSRDELLDALFVWQAAEPYRQVFLLSGDVHAASAFTIRQQGGPGVIQQFTSSAFTTQSSWLERRLNQTAIHAPNLFEARVRFQRHFFTLANNFGTVRLASLSDGGHRVELLIRAWQPATRSLRTAGRVVSQPPGM